MRARTVRRDRPGAANLFGTRVLPVITQSRRHAYARFLHLRIEAPRAAWHQDQEIAFTVSAIATASVGNPSIFRAATVFNAM